MDERRTGARARRRRFSVFYSHINQSWIKHLRNKQHFQKKVRKDADNLRREAAKTREGAAQMRVLPFFALKW